MARSLPAEGGGKSSHGAGLHHVHHTQRRTHRHWRQRATVSDVPKNCCFVLMNFIFLTFLFKSLNSLPGADVFLLYKKRFSYSSVGSSDKNDLKWTDKFQLILVAVFFPSGLKRVER